MPDNDSQLELKKRARRRLVGAAALAVLAAVVLPMVMDQEPKPPSQDIQIRIPSPDSGGAFNSRIIPPTKPAPAAAARDNGPEPDAASAAHEEAKAPVAESGTPGTVKPEPKTDAPKENPTAVKPSAATLDKRAAKPEAASPAKSGDRQSEKVAATKPGERADGNANAATGDQWVVQLGAFQNPANVRHLRTKLKSEGYSSYTEPLVSPSGNKTRVRAGPFPTKEAAEKARDKLKRIGLDGVVAQKQ